MQEGCSPRARAGHWCVDLGRMSAVLLATLLAVVSAPSARAVWLGRLDPQQVMAPLPRRGSGATCVLGPSWSPSSPGAPQTTGAAGGWAGGTAPHLHPLPQLMGSWYVLAVASGEKDFALEKATKSVEGVEVMLTSQNTLKMRASRHRWVGRGAWLGARAALPSLCTGLCCELHRPPGLRGLRPPGWDSRLLQRGQHSL